MARGKQKEQAREKAQKAAAARKGGKSQIQFREQGLQSICPICRTPNPNYKTMVLHMEAKHPGKPIPPEKS